MRTFDDFKDSLEIVKCCEKCGAVKRDNFDMCCGVKTIDLYEREFDYLMKEELPLAYEKWLNDTEPKAYTQDCMTLAKNYKEDHDA